MLLESVFLTVAITWTATSWLGFQSKGMWWPKRTGIDSIENIPPPDPPKVSIPSADTPFHFDGSVTKKAEQVLIWCQNHVGMVGHGHPNMASALRKAPEEISSLCGGMALFFREALALAGIQSRQVNLHRDLVEPSDGHVIVEVLSENGWIAYDPTFGLRYQLNGVPASAQAIHEYLREKGENIEIVELGTDTLYPAINIHDYYIGLSLLFNHVYYPYKENRRIGNIKGRQPIAFIKNKILGGSSQQLAYVIDYPQAHKSEKYANKTRIAIMLSRVFSLVTLALALFILVDAVAIL